MSRDFNLNQTNPAAVARVLEQTAQEFVEDASTLKDMWQDPNAGKVWEELAALFTEMSGEAARIAARHGFKQEDLR